MMINNSIENYKIIPFIKPVGFSSFDIIRFLRKKYGLSKKFKLGHAGTLDPFASGLLLVLSGKATQLNFLFQSFSKTYIAVAHFGIATDTGDITGEKIAESALPSEEAVRKICTEYTGEIEQTPHKYSAVKVDGQRAYQLIRENKKFELKSKTVRIYETQILSSRPEKGLYCIKIKCSSGTYIRSYIEDIAERIGVKAYTKALVRTQTGPFCLKHANHVNGKSSEILVQSPVYSFFEECGIRIYLDRESKIAIKYGQKENIKTIIGKCGPIASNQNMICFTDEDDLIRSVVQYDAEKDKIDFKFNYPDTVPDNVIK